MAGIAFLVGCVALIGFIIAFRNTPWVLIVTLAMLAAFPFYNDAAYNSCEGGCNIRIDLLIVGPLIVLAIILSIRRLWMMRKG